MSFIKFRKKEILSSLVASALFILGTSYCLGQATVTDSFNTSIGVSSQAGAASNAGAAASGAATAAGSAVSGAGQMAAGNYPPSAFSHTHLYHGPWNFIPPHILFHPSKTIGDGSIFCNCRLVNVTTNLKSSIKDSLFGVFDERKAVLSAVGRVSGATFAGPAVASNMIIVCGLNTNIPKKCATFIGSGNVFMENYSSTEGALVGLSQLGAKSGANIVGNVNCAYQESIQSFGVGVGAGGSYGDNIGNSGATMGLSLGGSWGTGITKRPAQPFCTGDFYVASLENCAGNGVEYSPAPRLYRRYLPPAVPATAPYYPQAQEPVRGLW